MPGAEVVGEFGVGGADGAVADDGSYLRWQVVALMRGAWTAVLKILVPLAWKTASNEAVKFDPMSGTSF